MAVDVTSIFAERLAGNRGPDPLNPDRRQRPNYQIAASLDGNTLAIVLTFRKGSVYCCMEWGCHLALLGGKRWDWLRKALAARGVAVPARLEMRLSCVVEEGAVFFDIFKPDPTRHRWYAFAPAAAYHYEVFTAEGPAAEPPNEELLI